jgi:nucleoside-diphosphate-sugar epimerase
MLREDCRVIFLARGTKGISPYDRVRKILGFVQPELDAVLEQRISVLECNISGRSLGISSHSLARLKQLKPDSLFHCAGSVAFSEQVRDLTMRTNLKGTENMCRLAAEAGVQEFHHMSTLYVAGKRNGYISEEPLSLQGLFNNPYEASKALAEQAVRRWSEDAGIPHIIYRLPIVLGHSATGRTLSFTGYYGFFKPFWHTVNRIRENAHKHAHHRSACIRITNGRVWAPLHVACGEGSTIDLVPIDWVARTIAQVAAKRNGGNMTVHLTHEEPPLSREVINASLKHLGMDGVQFAADGNPLSDDSSDRLLKTCQRGIDAIVSQFHPYATATKRFSVDGLKGLLGEDYMPPPRVDAELLSRMLAYATRVGFNTPPIA